MNFFFQMMEKLLYSLDFAWVFDLARGKATPK